MVWPVNSYLSWNTAQSTYPVYVPGKVSCFWHCSTLKFFRSITWFCLWLALSVLDQLCVPWYRGAIQFVIIIANSALWGGIYCCLFKFLPFSILEGGFNWNNAKTKVENASEAKHTVFQTKRKWGAIYCNKRSWWTTRWWTQPQMW